LVKKHCCLHLTGKVWGERRPEGRKEVFLQVLLFSLSGENCGIFIDTLEVILENPQIFSVPKTPVFIKGILNFRGRIITIFDLAMLMGLPSIVPPLSPRIVVPTTEHMQIGFLVSQVFDFYVVAEDQLMEPPPQSGTRPEERFVKYIFEKDQQVISVLDTGLLIKTIVEMSL
jgi:purine-binding chemotaxis protein CheW